jgi:hypothetical protein
MACLMRLSLLLLLALTVLDAGAQLRTIPADAKLGDMRHVQEMLVEIDGTTQRLAPGAQIRDADNRIVLPAALPERSRVRYLLDAEGMVRRVWILAPAEMPAEDAARE